MKSFKKKKLSFYTKHNKKNILFFIIYIFITILVRAHTFCRITADHDEASHIISAWEIFFNHKIMHIDIVNSKSLFLYLIFSIPIYFQKSVYAVRLFGAIWIGICLLYTSPSPRDA